MLKLSIIDLRLALPSTKEVTEGQTLTLICQTEGEPEPKFDPWIHTGEFISQRSLVGDIQGNTNTLTITNVNYTDTGLYQCRVENAIYNINIQANVTVRCKYIYIYRLIVFKLIAFRI